MRTASARLRPSLIAAGTAIAAAAALGAPSGASAAAYRDCSPSTVRPLNAYAAGFATLATKGVTCKRAVRLVVRALKTARDTQATGTPKVSGYRCRLSASHGASGGGDPFVEYTCSRGARRIKYMLVN